MFSGLMFIIILKRHEDVMECIIKAIVPVNNGELIKYCKCTLRIWSACESNTNCNFKIILSIYDLVQIMYYKLICSPWTTVEPSR
jgi:hypothetical protein